MKRERHHHSLLHCLVRTTCSVWGELASGCPLVPPICTSVARRCHWPGWHLTWDNRKMKKHGWLDGSNGISSLYCKVPGQRKQGGGQIWPADLVSAACALQEVPCVCQTESPLTGHGKSHVGKVRDLQSTGHRTWNWWLLGNSTCYLRSFLREGKMEGGSYKLFPRD